MTVFNKEGHLDLEGYHLRAPIRIIFLDGFLTVFILLLLAKLYTDYDSWLDDYVPISLICLLFYYTSSSLCSLYNSWRSGLIFRQIIRLFATWGLTFFFILCISFATKTTDTYSRVVFFSWALITPLALCFSHFYLGRRTPKSSFRDPENSRIVFAGHSGASLGNMLQINNDPSVDAFVYGYYSDHPWSDGSFRHLGHLADLVNDARDGSFHIVYLNFHGHELNQVAGLMESLSNSTVSVYWMIPSGISPVSLAPRIHTLGGEHAISLFESPFAGWQLQLKRIEDVVLGSLILLIILIPMIVIAVLVKATSPGPILFSQRRYGAGGKPFRMYKFRSMTVAEDGKDLKQATREDARITPLGGFLRRHSLDELPQFINVVLGQMSIVGPRPHANVHNEIYRTKIMGYMLRHKVKPGITGLAQISGCRGQTETEEKMIRRVEHDLAYIKHWSLWLDLKIIALTAMKGFNDPEAF